MSITLATNPGGLTANSGATNSVSTTIWSSLEASTNGSQSAQTTNALVSGPTSGTAALNGNLAPVIASAQATLDRIVANPTLNLSRVLTSPSFAALVSALEGNAGSGLSSNGQSDGVSGMNGSSSGSGNASASVLSIGYAAGNSSGVTVENSAAATGNEGFFSKLLSELESVLQMPTGVNAADGLLGGAGLNTASQTGTRLAVA